MANPRNSSVLARIWRWTRRTMLMLLAVVGVYLAAVAVGLYPVNSAFVDAGDEGIEIYVFSGAFHSDLILPIASEGYSWWDFIDRASFPGGPAGETHLSVGWGDRKFFTETPAWEDMKYSTVARAIFWPTETVMHVGLLHEPATGPKVRSVRITKAQYRELVTFVKAHFRRDEDEKLKTLDVSYGDHDTFYEAHGRYHIFRTCNCWVGKALKSSGVKVGCWTPLPKTVFWHLPDSS